MVDFYFLFSFLKQKGHYSFFFFLSKGIQFHPEVTHTPEGTILLSNFVLSICSCNPSWSMVRFFLLISKFNNPN